MVIVFLIPVRKQSALRQRPLSHISPFFATNTYMYMYTKLIDMNSGSLKMSIAISRVLNVTSAGARLPGIDNIVLLFYFKGRLMYSGKSAPDFIVGLYKVITTQ